jgi:hypothetical protein
MRACYMPDTWGLRVFVCNAAGRQKEGVSGVEEVVQDVAGPLCFQVGSCVLFKRLASKLVAYIAVSGGGAFLPALLALVTGEG